MKKPRWGIEVTGQEFGDKVVTLAPAGDNDTTPEELEELVEELIERGYEAEIVQLRSGDPVEATKH
jgi:hypothetical protein